MQTNEPLYLVNADSRSTPMLSAVRGVVVLAGWKALRARGLFERYSAIVKPEVLLALTTTTANDWIAMDVVDAHEQAFDQLDLSRDDARAIGAEMSRTLNGVLYSTLARLAGTLGASPWLVFAQANKTWARFYRGGAVAVLKRGPRDACVEVWGDVLTPYALHREAFGGALLHVVASYCEKPTMNELRDARASTMFSFLVRW